MFPCRRIDDGDASVGVEKMLLHGNRTTVSVGPAIADDQCAHDHETAIHVHSTTINFCSFGIQGAGLHEIEIPKPIITTTTIIILLLLLLIIIDICFDNVVTVLEVQLRGGRNKGIAFEGQTRSLQGVHGFDGQLPVQARCLNELQCCADQKSVSICSDVARPSDFNVLCYLVEFGRQT